MLRAMANTTVAWKYALLSISTVISLLTVVLISSGVLALGAAGSPSGAYIVTCIGSIVFVICFVGCCASLRESFSLSMMFVGLTVATIAVQTIFMITFAVMKDDLLHDAQDRVQELWDLEDDAPDAFNAIQKQYYCCGFESPQDYLQDDDDVLPKSCCIAGDCSNDAAIFAKGCFATVGNFFDEQSDNLILILIALILTEGLGTIAAWFLGKSLEHRVTKNKQIIIEEGTDENGKE